MSKSAELTELLAPVVQNLGYEFVGLQYLPQGRHALLRIYIDREAGVTVGDCANVSRELSALLDVRDPIKSAYTLEVSSPGLDRPLFTPEHFEQFIGKRARVTLTAPLEGQRKFDGLILGVEEQTVLLKHEERQVELPFQQIQKANLIAEV